MKCSKCGSDWLEETNLDRYPDAIYRRFVCCDCNCTFVAKYSFKEVVNGSIRETDTIMKNATNNRNDLAGQTLQKMFQLIDERGR